MIGAPPSLAGGSHAIVTPLMPAVARKLRGGPGALICASPVGVAVGVGGCGVRVGVGVAVGVAVSAGVSVGVAVGVGVGR